MLLKNKISICELLKGSNNMFIEISDNYYNVFEVKNFHFSEQYQKIVVELKDGTIHYLEVPEAWIDMPKEYLKQIDKGIKITTGMF